MSRLFNALKNQLVFVLLLLVIFSCKNNEGSKNEFSFEEVYFQDDQRRAFIKIDNSPINGSVIQKNKNGKKIIELPYNKGVLDGYVRIWSDSILKFEFYYIDGIENGKWRVWNDKENLNYEQSYKNGKSDGIWEKWYENGQLACEVNYNNGVLDGIAKIYHENGKLEREVSFNANKEEGILQAFFPSGKIKATYSFKEGEENGTCYNYYENGQIRTKFNYLNGLRNGKCQSYFENGKLRGEGNFLNDQTINIKILDSLGKLVFQSSNQKVILNNEIPYHPHPSESESESEIIDKERYLGDPDLRKFNKDLIFHPWDKFEFFQGHSRTVISTLLTRLEFYESLSKVKKKEVTKQKT